MTWGEILKYLAVTTVACTVAGLMGLVIAGFITGCGESYVDARGVRHVVQCEGFTPLSSWWSTTDHPK